VDNNVQLMVSFRDQQEDGEFTLIPENTEDNNSSDHSREYVYIHDVNYATSAHASIAQNGGANRGHTYWSMYFFWPVLREGKLFEPGNLDSDTVVIRYSPEVLQLRSASLSNVSDAYGNYSGKNP